MAATMVDAANDSDEQDEEGAAPSCAKRPGAELEPEASHAKKRRKQSKPVRIAAAAAAAEGEVGAEDTRCPYCAEQFASAELTKLHIESDHFHNGLEALPLNLSSLQSSDSASPVDFAVGSWMSDGTKASASASPAMLSGFLPLAPPFLLPMLPHNASAGGATIRIFNPEAYCELCNKEFCNKYFLKTHKANKHGIYIDNSAVPLGSNAVPGPPFTGSFIATNATMPPVVNAPQTSGNTSPPISKSTEVGNDTKSGGNGTMRAFCDICQKKFCNKYFVRRHKAKIHGILDDCSTPPGCTFQPADCVRKIEFDEPGSVSASSDAGSYALDTSYGHTPTHTSETEDPRVGTFEKTESNSEAGRKSSPVNSGTDEAAGMIKAEPGGEQEAEPKPAPKDGLFSTDRLRKLGVINADAFCEICCKEYCNKYFLRTHKMKRHGILITDGEGKDSRPERSWSWTNTQTSPLNLIVGEQGTNSSDSGEKVRADMSDGEDPECDVCGRRFQSTYLMQMHRAYLHKPAGENSKEEASHNNNNNNEGNNNGNNAKDTISEDLQKLQTMILQLNNLNVNKVTTCSICNKDLENRYFLRAHMMTEHGVLIDEAKSNESEKQTSSENTSPPPVIDPETFCFLCKKDFFSKYFLKLHADECHAYTTPPATVTSVLPINNDHDPRDASEKTPIQASQQATPEKRVPVTPTSSYCEICNKELCNKYFMKTHMQRMHGIEIENGAQIGGVICDVCNKELCSKYFLRVHKQNTHGIVEDGSSHAARESAWQAPVEPDTALKPSELGDLSHRYYSHFTEACPVCHRRFRSTKWLKAHLLNDHGESGVDKWKELENHYSSQSQQPKQAAKSSGTLNSSGLEPGSSHSPTLKIPNNWNTRDVDCVSQQPEYDAREQPAELGSQQVFSNLFGAGDSSIKNYHCSYCSFSTPVLAFLFVHERSHTGISSQPFSDPAKPFQCPVCFQSFLHSDLFQHHILTHQFSGLLNPFLPAIAPAGYPMPFKALPQGGEHVEDGDSAVAVLEDEASTLGPGKLRFRCSKCFLRFKSQELCLAHAHSKHRSNSPNSSSSLDTSKVNVTPEGMYNCTQCGFSSVHLTILKKHIRKEHEDESCRLENKVEKEAEPWLEMKDVVSDEVKKKLQDAARKSQVPASYAVPQTVGRFIMQPFLLEEPGAVPVDLDRKFAPSLVFLPVREKLSEPLTVSFTLTPA